MRKEKSRDAARSRRGKENYEFYELAKLLPLPAAITTQLDKASIIRLSISYLRLRDFTAHGDPPWSRDPPSTSKALKGGSIRSRSASSIAIDIFEQHQGTHILQSLDGFAFALSADGRFLYISETVSIYLGLSQVEMTGSSIFDYIHQQDHAELAEQLGINISQSQSQAVASSPGSSSSEDGSSSSATTPTGLDRPVPMMTLNGNTPYKGMDRSFCIRMKSTLTKRGCHFKSSGYRVVLVLSHLRPQYGFPQQQGRGKQGQVGGVLGMVALAIALPPPSINEVRLESDMFVTRLTFEFRVAHCEPRVSELLDYSAEELTGKNMYALCHGQDVQKLRKCHVDLINKGQVMSGYYRIMNKNGGYTWLQTCATVICNSKNSDEQSIICVNYVISGTEHENCILDCSQMPDLGNLKPDDPSSSDRGSSPDTGGRDDASSREGCCSSPKQSRNEGRDAGREHIAHLVKQHSDSIRVTRDTCGIRDDCAPNGYEMDQKQMDLSGDMVRYQDGVSRHSSCMDGSSHGRTKKRRLNGHHSHLLMGDTHNEPKSPQDGVSTLNGSSPLEGVDRVTPDRLGSASSDLRHTPTTPPSSGDVGGSDKIDRPWKRSPRSYSSSTMSVKELENAMNKHLPSSSQEEGLEKGGAGQQRSTIQWIGAPQTTLPASSLLRQIYVNRESVIRSGTHLSRPAYYADPPQGPLPTPPGSGDPSYPNDQGQSQQFALPGKEPYGVITGYSPVTSYVDTPYSAMTPPASVSPRDKFHPGIADTFSEAAAAAAAAAIPHMHHPYDLQHLPLKPQVFVHPGTYHAQEQQQQGLYHASGFHLYHPSPAGTSKATSSHHTSNGSSWYPQPST